MMDGQGAVRARPASVGDELTRACGEHLLARQQGVGDAVVSAVSDEFPDLVGDATLHREFAATVHGNITTILRMHAGHDVPTPVPMDQAQILYARTMRRRGLPVERFLGATRLGQSVFARIWLEAVSARTTDLAALTRSLARSSEHLDDYLGRSVTAVVAAYQADGKGTIGRQIARRIAMVPPDPAR